MPAPATEPVFDKRRLVLGLFLLSLLWPALMLFPGAPETYLDASWQLVLINSHAEGWQFGRDVIFTWGPWGFLMGHYHLGETGAVAKLVWEIAGKFALAALLVWLTRRLPVWRQVAFITGLALFTWLFADVAFYLVISAVVLRALLIPAPDRVELALFPAALGFLSCFKFTYPALALGGLGLAVAAHVWRRDFRAALLIAGSFVAGFLLSWIAAGQALDNIVPYFRRGAEITSGYADAMGVDEPPAVFVCGILLLFLLAAQAWQLARRHPDRALGLAVALYLAGAWFVVWKASFTRADGHVFGFFLFALLAALIVHGPDGNRRRPHWFDLSVPVALIGMAQFEPGLLARMPGIGLARIRENYAALPRVPQMPLGWEGSLSRARETAHLPAVKAAVGTATVDVFNYEQGVALLNGLKYRPRPVFQSYSAYSSRLGWRNLRHYRGAKAPEFVLWKHQTIDGRFPTQDDAQLVAELRRGYAPVLEEGGFILLRKRAPLPAEPLQRRTLLETSLAFDEELPLPPVGTHPRWLQVRLPLSKLGRLRTFFYKPPVAYLVTRDFSGAERSWRLLPRVAEDGFLLDPLLETQADFADFMRGRGVFGVKSIRLTTDPAQREFWSIIWDRPTIRLSELPELPLTATAPYESLVRQGLFSHAPDAIVSVHSLESFTLSSGPALQVHAPGEIRFNVPDDATAISGIIGLRDGAATGPDHTDGVQFVLELSTVRQATTVLWERTLSPADRATDAGPQTFAAPLPPGNSRTLALKLLPGPAGDNRSDWSYVSAIRFSSASRP